MPPTERSPSGDITPDDESPPPPSVILAPRRLDEDFCIFLANYITDPEADGRLVRYITENGILNPYGDRLDKVHRLFADEAQRIKPWIPDGSRLKEKLKDFPAIYYEIWPEEAPIPQGSHDSTSSSISELPKRKRDEGHGGDTHDNDAASVEPEQDERGGPEPQTTKRRRVRPPPPEVEFESEDENRTGSELAIPEETRSGEGDDQPHEPVSAERHRDPLDQHETTKPSDVPPKEEVEHTPPTSLPSDSAEHETQFTPEELPSPPPAAGYTPPTRDFDPDDTAWMDSSDLFPFPLPPHHVPFPSPDIQPDYTVPVPPAETVDPDEHLRGVTRLIREGWEWTEDTSYRGTRQPPFGVRLEHALNFLREEDVDRCRDWEKKLSELEEWLDWIEYEDESRMRERCGVLVGNMYRDVRRKAKAHRLFEKEKYGAAKWGDGIKGSEEVLLPKKGRRVVVGNVRGLEVGVKVEHEGPRTMLVAQPERVNTQFHPVDSVDDEQWGEMDWFLKRLNESEQAFWAAEGGDPEGKDHLFRLENAAYEACSGPMGPLMKFKTKGGQGGLVLPSEAQLPPQPDGEKTVIDKRLRKYAIERGARRAALQEALRCFTNTEQILATTEWNRVVPTVEQSVLQAVRSDLDRNYQWKPTPTAPVGPDKLETMPYTFLWRLHRQLLADLGEHVRKGVNDMNANTRGWVTVPKGVAYGGPFVWRMVDPDVQEQEDILKECEAVFKAIVATPVTTGEADSLSLLEAVKRYAHGAASGDFGMTGLRGLPGDLQLTSRDLDTAGRLVKSITREELKWLGFLTSNYANDQILRAAAENQPKLYDIFVARLEKVMDNRGEGALFLKADQWLTIEELLDVMNKGCDGTGETVKFSPFQAKYFLERAQEQGLCRYREDPMIYGRVSRSIRDIEPQDRINLRVTTADSGGHQHLVPLFPDDIRSFNQLPATTADDRQLRHNFFCSLGLRLGLTLLRLRRNREESRKAQPMGTSHLLNALRTFSSAYRKVKEEYASQSDISSTEPPKPGLSLASFVENVDPAMWESVVPRVLESLPREDLTMEQERAATETAALGIIRHKIIKESNENLSMLGHGRGFNFSKPDGTVGSAWVRDHSWDWASVNVRGKAKQFFGLDRWPLELLSEKTRREIGDDKFIDPQMILDPDTEDPIPREYFRTKPKRFGEEKVRHRPGPAIYPVGDTPLQRRMVREMLIDRVAKATNRHPVEQTHTWKQTLADMLPWRRFTTPSEYGMVATSLPEVDPGLVPESWTPPTSPPVSNASKEGGNIEAEDTVMQSIEPGDDVEMDEA